MAKKQINELAELTTAAAEDLLPVYDLDEGGSEKTKKITIDHFQWTYTAQTATTAGTTVELTTSIPAWATDVEIILNGVSTSTDNQPPIIQLGDSGGYETTGYDSSAHNISTGDVGGSYNYTDGFYTIRIPGAEALAAHNIIFTLTRWDADEHYWHCLGGGSNGEHDHCLSYGNKTLSGSLDRIRLTTPGGSATFDGGEARVRYR